MTTTNRTTVVGVFTERSVADRAIETLHQAGFTNDQIGFVVRDQNAGGPYEGLGSATTTGAVSGGVLGGVLGAAVALLIPGIGPALAGGVLTATLGGVAIGAVAGGLVGALTDMGVPEEEARYYQQELASGRTIVTVHALERSADAQNILRANGAYDVHTRPDTSVDTVDRSEPDYIPPTVGAYNPDAPFIPPPPATPPVEPVQRYDYNTSTGAPPVQSGQDNPNMEEEKRRDAGDGDRD